MKFLNDKYSKALTLILLVEVVAFYWFVRRAEIVPPIAPLSQFPASIGAWNLEADLVVEPEVQAVLKADDTLSRVYKKPDKSQLYMFIAYFKTQRAGQSPHSPKNCLPGAGWEPLESTVMPIALDGRDAPIVINKYVVAHGSEKRVTLYWYQSRDRVIASEFAARFWLVADSVRYHHSDTALVKVEVPVKDDDIEAAVQYGTSFIQLAFPKVREALPK